MPTKASSRTATARASSYQHNWQNVSVKETLKKLYGNEYTMTYTTSGKTVYKSKNPLNEVQVTYDNAGRYFTVQKGTPSGYQYLDKNGNVIPNNVPLIKEGGRTTTTGIPPEIRRGLTHFKDID